MRTAMVEPIVKVCGITRGDDAEMAVDLGAALIGLNFWSGSPRCIDPETALAIADRVRGRALVVGVFVDAPVAAVAAIAMRVGLDLVQPHGHELPAFADELAQLGGPAVVPAIRSQQPPRREDLDAWPRAWGFLFDRYDPVRFGGTGESWNWETMRSLPRDKPLLVAGGVRPGRARRALEESGASGIDVCSGVESSPGIKDRDALERLFAEVRDVSIVAPA